MVADDHPAFCKSIADIVACDSSFEMAGEAYNGQELLLLLEKKHADLVLLDIEMPVMNGWQVLPVMQKKYRETKVIIVSMYDDESIVRGFIGNGARAFIPKSSAVETYLEVMHHVSKRGLYITDKQKIMLVKESTAKPLKLLTEAEFRVLPLLCDGRSNNEIAVILGLKTSTIKTHRENIYRKNAVNNIASLVKFVFEHRMPGS